MEGDGDSYCDTALLAARRPRCHGGGCPERPLAPPPPRRGPRAGPGRCQPRGGGSGHGGKPAPTLRSRRAAGRPPNAEQSRTPGRRSPALGLSAAGPRAAPGPARPRRSSRRQCARRELFARALTAAPRPAAPRRLSPAPLSSAPPFPLFPRVAAGSPRCGLSAAAPPCQIMRFSHMESRRHSAEHARGGARSAAGPGGAAAARPRAASGQWWSRSVTRGAIGRRGRGTWQAGGDWLRRGLGAPRCGRPGPRGAAGAAGGGPAALFGAAGGVPRPRGRAGSGARRPRTAQGTGGGGGARRCRVLAVENRGAAPAAPLGKPEQEGGTGRAGLGAAARRAAPVRPFVPPPDGKQPSEGLSAAGLAELRRRSASGAAPHRRPRVCVQRTLRPGPVCTSRAPNTNVSRSPAPAAQQHCGRSLLSVRTRLWALDAHFWHLPLNIAEG